jgi:hypothetical protein
LQLLNRVLERRAVMVADLRPPRDTRLHAVANCVIRDLARELVDEIRTLRTRADEACLRAAR